MIEISTGGHIHQFYKKVSSWLSFCFPTFNWLFFSQTCRLLVSAGGLGKKISMIFQLKTNQWSHLPPSVTLNEFDTCRLHQPRDNATQNVLKTFFLIVFEFSLFKQHTLYSKMFNDDECTEYGWNLFGEPFLYQNSSWMPSLIIFFRWIWTARGRRNFTNLPHEPFQVWAGRKLLQQIFKRTVLVHYLHANERVAYSPLSETYCSGH